MNKLQARAAQRGQGGFTLIELLVVIAILGILAGVVVFAVGNSTNNAKLTACQTEVGSIKTAVAAAEASNLVNTTKENYSAYLESNTKYFTASGSVDAQDLAFAPKTGSDAPPAGCLASGMTSLGYNTATPKKFVEKA